MVVLKLRKDFDTSLDKTHKYDERTEAPVPNAPPYALSPRGKRIFEKRPRHADEKITYTSFPLTPLLMLMSKARRAPELEG